MSGRSAPYLQWSPAFDLGVPALDGQHRTLVDRINELHQATGGPAEGMFRVLNGLVRYAEEHFREEEARMASVRYPGLPRQRREHEGFLTTVFALAERLARDDPELGEELLGFLKDWLLDHILHEDRTFARFLEERAPAAPPARGGP